MRYFLYSVLLLWSFSAHGRPGFANLQPGPLAVGWKMVQQYDDTRIYKDKIDLVSGRATQGERARPIQTHIWYPALKGGSPVAYGDYVRTELSEDDFGRTRGELDAFLASRLKDAGTRIGAAQAKAVFGQPMWAVRDAAALPGKYPVVIYAPGGGGVGYEPADLGEYLASHGYIVIASRNLGPRSRMITVADESIDAQMRDIQQNASTAAPSPTSLRHSSRTSCCR
ncbi:hypothetical protein [Pseudoduganella sp. GCM10020061]|uniref:hypothetical protein n=1 Tax=Pseudoduganella sp. GCM10020061 TaxID=3317345 RepID=UPI00363B7B2C